MSDAVLDSLVSLPPGALAAVSVAVFGVSAALLYYRHHSPAVGVASVGSRPTAQPRHSEDNGSRMNVVLLYGTQTGTAERFAKQLAGEATSRYADKARVKAIDIEDWDFKAEMPKANVLLLLFATYGDGEPTDSAGNFVEWLKAQEEADEEPLSGIPYSVFGLGNRQYEHFNAVGKMLDKLLGKVGAKRVVPLGLGDDDENIDEDFEKWSSSLWTAMDGVLGSDGIASGTGEATAHAAPAYECRVLSTGSRLANGIDEHGHGHGQGAAKTKLVPVAEVRELHGKGSERSCVHVELDLSDTGLSYVAGDHIGVHPENPKEAVELAGMLLDVPLDSVVELALPAGEAGDLLSAPPPTPATLRSLLAFHYDLLGPLTRPQLSTIASCATDPKEAAHLKLLSSPAGKKEYGSWVSGAQRSLLCVMQEFPSARPELGLFFASVATRLQPRYYSISSAPSASKGGTSLSITCAVVDEKTPSGRRHQGVASTWLKHFSPGSSLPAHVRTSTFKLPRRGDIPLVMVGPGTGLAPFRGFLQARIALKEAGKELGEAVLFFGCRDRKKDFIYQEELAGFLEAGAITELHTAFSREDPKQKDYVQHHLLAQAAKVWELLNDGGYLYVCGDAKHMAKDVHAALIEAGQVACGWDKDTAARKVHELSDGGRYMRDVW